MSRCRSHRLRAFTLLEMIVAGLVISIVVAAASAGLASMIRTREMSRARVEANRTAELAIASIVSDLQGVIRDGDLYYVKIQIEDGGNARGRGQDVTEQDELLIFTKSDRPIRSGIQAESGEYEVQYRLAEGPAIGGLMTDNQRRLFDAERAQESLRGGSLARPDPDLTLWRRADPEPDDAYDGGGVVIEVASQITRLSIQAHDGIRWEDNWDSDEQGIPHAVRVTIVAHDEKKRARSTVMRTISMERVPLPFVVIPGLGDEGGCAVTRHRGAHPGFALIIVIGVLGLSAALLVSVQSTAFGDAGLAREQVARTRAHWAARAGLESTVARLATTMTQGPTNNAYATRNQLQDVSRGDLGSAVWEIRHVFDGDTLDGPLDTGAKININRIAQSPSAIDDLLELPGMTEDIAAAILDWIDSDDLVSELGAERATYDGVLLPYVPRNAPIRTLRELELVRGVTPEMVRGEDWNLNGVLDANERDGSRTWPNDDGDWNLDAGWSQYITCESVEATWGPDGRERLFLPSASVGDVLSRIDGLSTLQARVMLNYANTGDALLTDFLGTSLRQMASDSGDPALNPQAVSNLSTEQIGQVLERCTMDDPGAGPIPARLNLNTTSREILGYTPVFRGVAGEGVADILLLARTARGGGFTSIIDLLDFLPAQQLQIVAQYIDVRSGAYEVTSRGVDVNTGYEVQIQATIQQTGLPIVISEMVVR